jgi:hypothetical protein
VQQAPGSPVRPAKAFGPHDIAIDTDRYRQPRQVLLGETFTDNLLPLRDGIGPLGRWAECVTDGVSSGFGCRALPWRSCTPQSPMIATGINPMATTLNASQVSF